MGEHGDSEFAVWSHANVAGVNLENYLKDVENFNAEEVVDLFVSVRDAAYSIIDKKVLHSTVSLLPLHVLLKLFLTMKMPFFQFLYIKTVNTQA